MLNKNSLLRRVLGDTPPPNDLPNGELTRFSSASRQAVQAPEHSKDATERVIPETDQRLSRFAARHTRAKPKSSAPYASENAHLIAQQISNDGVEMIPLSVLQDALPDRVVPQGGLEALGAMMEASIPWEPLKKQ